MNAIQNRNKRSVYSSMSRGRAERWELRGGGGVGGNLNALLAPSASEPPLLGLNVIYNDVDDVGSREPQIGGEIEVGMKRFQREMHRPLSSIYVQE